MPKHKADECHNAKSTNEEVAEIYRRARYGKERPTRLAKEFGRHVGVISDIKCKRKWLSVTDKIDEELRGASKN